MCIIDSLVHYNHLGVLYTQLARYLRSMSRFSTNATSILSQLKVFIVIEGIHRKIQFSVFKICWTVSALSFAFSLVHDNRLEIVGY